MSRSLFNPTATTSECLVFTHSLPFQREHRDLRPQIQKPGSRAFLEYQSGMFESEYSKSAGSIVFSHTAQLTTKLSFFATAPNAK